MALKKKREANQPPTQIAGGTKKKKLRTCEGPIEEPLRDGEPSNFAFVDVAAEGEPVRPDEAPHIRAIRKPVPQSPPANGSARLEPGPAKGGGGGGGQCVKWRCVVGGSVCGTVGGGFPAKPRCLHGGWRLPAFGGQPTLTAPNDE